MYKQVYPRTHAFIKEQKQYDKTNANTRISIENSKMNGVESSAQCIILKLLSNNIRVILPLRKQTLLLL